MDISGNKTDTDSPCVGVCSLTRGGEVCNGCGRNLEEVTFWPQMSDNDKREANKESAQRLKGLQDA